MKLLLLLPILFSLSCLAQKVPKSVSIGYSLPPTYIVTWIDQNGKDSITYECDQIFTSGGMTISYINKYNHFASVHRKHVLGMIFDTYPPVYSCRYCFKEICPQYLLPPAYLHMKIPIAFGKDTLVYMNGYSRFCDSLKRNHMDEDSFFVERWNEMDTTCLSTEISLNKSRDISNHWKATHNPGYYWLDKQSCMYMGDGTYFMDYYDTKGKFIMGSGGRYNDSTLLADKWYKVTYDKPKKKN